MNLRLFICIGIMIPGWLIADDTVGKSPAPLVTVVFSNENNQLETVFTLVKTGEFYGNKNAGAYYPQFVPAKAQIKRDAFVFDPYAIQAGPNVYPFMFTYKGEFYYLVFVTTLILQEKTDFPFFASIVKIKNIPQSNKPVEIETVANLFFKQNDIIAVGFLKDRLAFVNTTNKTVAAFVGRELSKAVSSPQTVPVNITGLAKPAPRPAPPVPSREPVAPVKPPRKLPQASNPPKPPRRLPNNPATPPIPPARAN